MKNNSISKIFLISIASAVVLLLSYSFIKTDTKNNTPKTSVNSTKKEQPIELGKINWLRDINVAMAQSKEKQKPILILFQEVPGCSTCRNYGSQALRNTKKINSEFGADFLSSFFTLKT